MERNDILIFVLAVISAFSSCACQAPILNKYSNEQIARFAQTDSIRGAIVIPLPDNQFCFIDNDVIRGRIYYDYYINEFPSYEIFLSFLLNKPGAIDLTLCGITNYETVDKELQADSYNSNFSAFLDKYTVTVNSDSDSLLYIRKIKPAYYAKRQQIARICSLKGLYVFLPDCFSDWIISDSADPIPPDNRL